MEYIKEEGILIINKKVFNDYREHEYNLKCYDGYAECEPTDERDKVLMITYPKLDEILSDERKCNFILRYRGLTGLCADDITYGDIAVVYGRICNVKYAVCCYMNEVIDVFDTRQEAVAALAEYEEHDMDEGIFESGFYNIKEIEIYD